MTSQRRYGRLDWCFQISEVDKTRGHRFTVNSKKCKVIWGGGDLFHLWLRHPCIVGEATHSPVWQNMFISGQIVFISCPLQIKGVNMDTHLGPNYGCVFVGYVEQFTSLLWHSFPALSLLHEQMHRCWFPHSSRTHHFITFVTWASNSPGLFHTLPFLF